jgi:hypothetical protein
MDRWSEAWSEHAVTVLAHVSRAVSSDVDSIGTMVQVPANVYAASMHRIDQTLALQLGQEAVSGHPSQAVFPLVAKLQRLCMSNASASLNSCQDAATAADFASASRATRPGYVDVQGHSAAAHSASGSASNGAVAGRSGDLGSVGSVSTGAFPDSSAFKVLVDADSSTSDASKAAQQSAFCGPTWRAAVPVGRSPLIAF